VSRIAISKCWKGPIEQITGLPWWSSASKEIMNKMKRQPTEGEKIFANDAIDYGLTSKIYKQLI